MKHIDSHTAGSRLFQLAPLLEDLHAGCDPDFDTAIDELEREFAELRCHLADA